HLKVDSSLLHTPLSMSIYQKGASEIYLNGKLIHSLGVVGSRGEKEVLYNPNYMLYSFQFSCGRDQVLAVRYSFQKHNPYLNFLGIWGGNPTLVILVEKMDVAVQSFMYGNSFSTSRLIGKGIFLLF